MANDHSCFEFLLSASPALLRNHELFHPQEIQQTLIRRNRKSYGDLGNALKNAAYLLRQNIAAETVAILVETTGRVILQNTCDCRTKYGCFSARRS